MNWRYADVKRTMTQGTIWQSLEAIPQHCTPHHWSRRPWDRFYWYGRTCLQHSGAMFVRSTGKVVPIRHVQLDGLGSRAAIRLTAHDGRIVQKTSGETFQWFCLVGRQWNVPATIFELLDPWAGHIRMRNIIDLDGSRLAMPDSKHELYWFLVLAEQALSAEEALGAASACGLRWQLDDKTWSISRIELDVKNCELWLNSVGPGGETRRDQADAERIARLRTFLPRAGVLPTRWATTVDGSLSLIDHYSDLDRLISELD